MLLPAEIHNKRINLFIDIFKIAGVKFFICESSRIQYVEIYSILSRSLDKIALLLEREITDTLKED